MYRRLYRHIGCWAAGVLVALAPAAWAASDLSRTVGDTTIHLGIARLADAAKRHPSDQGEVMHDARRASRAAHHLSVALFDAKSGERVTDAEVRGVVSEPGLGIQDKPLVPMSVGNVVSYGNTFDLRSGTRYGIRIIVWRQGAHAPVEASFDYARP